VLTLPGRQHPLAGVPTTDLAVGVSDAAMLVAHEILQAGPDASSDLLGSLAR
jgi:hypothetical protein